MAQCSLLEMRKHAASHKECRSKIVRSILLALATRSVGAAAGTMMDLPYETKWDRSGKPYWRRNNMRGTSGDTEAGQGVCFLKENSGVSTVRLGAGVGWLCGTADTSSRLAGSLAVV
jgi:hypothetical protein